MKLNLNKATLLALSAATFAAGLPTVKTWNMRLVEGLLLLVWIFIWRDSFPNRWAKTWIVSLVFVAAYSLVASTFTIRDLFN